MSSIEPKSKAALDVDFSLSSLIGSPKLLPEESVADYQRDLTALVSELQTTSPLAVMLAEQLVESVWWARRHSQDKACIILNAMTDRLSEYVERGDVREAFYLLQSDPGNHEAKEYIEAKLSSRGYTMSSLRAMAVSGTIDKLKVLDDLIRQHMNTVRHIQKSMDAVDLKPRLMKRLDLQIASLERDLNALEHDQ